jgi:hypothetical protein
MPSTPWADSGGHGITHRLPSVIAIPAGDPHKWSKICDFSALVALQYFFTIAAVTLQRRVLTPPNTFAYTRMQFTRRGLYLESDAGD